MKHATKTILLATVLLFITNFRAHAQEKLAVRVDGLSCAFCAYSLEKNLKELSGVKNVEINVKEGTATLTLDDGVEIKDEVIKQTVKDSGFTPKSVKKVKEAK
jgi:mercuric ion binding protein